MTNPAIQDGREAIRQAISPVIDELMVLGWAAERCVGEYEHRRQESEEDAAISKLFALIELYAARERAAGAAEALNEVTRQGAFARAKAHLQACEDKLREAMG